MSTASAHELCKSKSTFGGMEVSDAKRLMALENEDRKLKGAAGVDFDFAVLVPMFGGA